MAGASPTFEARVFGGFVGHGALVPAVCLLGLSTCLLDSLFACLFFFGPPALRTKFGQQETLNTLPPEIYAVVFLEGVN